MMYEVNKEYGKLFWCIDDDDDDGERKMNFQVYFGLKLVDFFFLYFSVVVDLNKFFFCEGCVLFFQMCVFLLKLELVYDLELMWVVIVMYNDIRYYNNVYRNFIEFDLI